MLTNFSGVKVNFEEAVKFMEKDLVELINTQVMPIYGFDDAEFLAEYERAYLYKHGRFSEISSQNPPC